jgi:regulatory associated protein of mTOR
VVSGSFSGEIKIWDLRFSTSLRTHNVQRSPMTALAIHRSIPLIATGSHAQFIKLYSLDGDTLEVIRYHEEMAGHRIGPVGCLAFHPHKPLLASGGTDAIVGIYAPKNTVLL